MNLLPPDHAERYRLADEVHARPPEAVETPSRATHVAVLVAPEQRSAEQAHLGVLCAHFGVPPPQPQATQFSADLGSVRLKWERHGEFSGYTLFAAGRSPAPFSEPALSILPAQWLAGVPGSTIFAAHAKLIPFGDEVPSPEFLAQHFDANVPVGAEIGGGAGLAFTDFKIRADGCARFLVLDRGFTPRQAGRTLQRLFEIETYRMMALLALPVAREQAVRVVATERSLASLTEDIARGHGDDEALLQALTGLAAEVESGLAASQFRFGACRAYHDLVTTRISELRERRLPGIQTIEEFMARRFTPAVATCASTSQRLHDLSERVAQACGLLSTRVDIARERQNQMLLESMNRRAKLQLRLQQTVEGLSVAAIVYYVAGLIGYLSKGLKASGLRLDPDLVVGIAIPVVAALAVWVLRRAHRRNFKADGASPAHEL
ncbi:MAG: DUF3422 domain-containing protein [Burkholderiales bacterium]|nr:DUF3422 domain-containing protein [Burkholderiales bacterium]